MKNFVIVCFLVLILKSGNAAQGCLVNDRMYTSFGINILSEPIFTTATYVDGNGKCWSGVSGVCKVCDGTISLSVGGLLICLGDLLGPRTGNVYQGEYFSSYSIIDCPLDDYTWAITLASGTFGLIMIRRRIK